MLLSNPRLQQLPSAMAFFNRTWTDAEKWAMGMVASLIVAALLAIPRLVGGDVTLEVASKRDAHGRCIDAELVVRNGTKADASDIKITFDIDYFTRQQAVSLEYGDERSQLIPPGQQTLLPRGAYAPVTNTFDPVTGILLIPRLQAGESVHLYYGGEPILDYGHAAARSKLLAAKDPALMDRPRILSAYRKDGEVKLKRVLACAP